MLSLNSPILADDIGEVVELKTDVVYLLRGHNGDKVVVKAEGVNKDQLRSVNMTVKTVFPSAKSMIVTTGEAMAVNQYIASLEYKVGVWEETGLPFDRTELEAVGRLKMALTQHGARPLVKMAALNEVQNLMDALQQRLGPNRDKSGVREFTAALNAKGGLEKLGKLIAIDFFNGNADRFDWALAKGGSFAFGTDESFKPRYMTRPNNVFLAVTNGGAPEVVPLDFIDSTSSYSALKGDLNRSLAEDEAVDFISREWPGRILADKKRRKEFAEGVVHDLELVLNPHKGKYSLRTKLSFGAAGRVEEGMVDGAKLIRGRLEAKYRTQGWPRGAEDRYRILMLVKR